jgi:hypothetical protein
MRIIKGPTKTMTLAQVETGKRQDVLRARSIIESFSVQARRRLLLPSNQLTFSGQATLCLLPNYIHVAGYLCSL